MPRSSPLIARFREWYAHPIDLPGTYYLEVVQRLYKDNQLATGCFAALGRPIDLAMVRGPIFLLAARRGRRPRTIARRQTSCRQQGSPHGDHGLHASRAVHGGNHAAPDLARDRALARGYFCRPADEMIA